MRLQSIRTATRTGTVAFAAVLLLAACGEEETPPGVDPTGDVESVEDLEEASPGDLAVDVGRCGPEDAEAVAAALDIEVVDQSSSAGAMLRDAVSINHQTCRFTSAEGGEYEVGRVTDEADAPADVWAAMLEMVPEPVDPDDVLAGSGLDELVDDLVVTDDELVLRTGDDGYFFNVTLGFAADENPSLEQLQTLAAMAAEVMADPPTDPHEFCSRTEEAVVDHFGEPERTRGPSMGSGTADDIEYEFRGCTSIIHDDLEVESGIGDAATFDGRVARADSDLFGDPEPVAGLGVQALSWHDEIFVPVGDDELYFFSGRHDVGDRMDADELVAFVSAVLSG